MFFFQNGHLIELFMNQYRKRYVFDREGNNSDISHIWKINTIYVSDLIFTYMMRFINIELIV